MTLDPTSAFKFLKDIVGKKLPIPIQIIEDNPSLFYHPVYKYYDTGAMDVPDVHIKFRLENQELSFYGIRNLRVDSAKNVVFKLTGTAENFSITIDGHTIPRSDFSKWYDSSARVKYTYYDEWSKIKIELRKRLS
jgi:hypothetical protein